MLVSDKRGRRTTYECVVGHEIPQQDLETRTAVRSLDEGAKVQVCLEHGAPIAIRVAPEATQPSRSGS